MKKASILTIVLVLAIVCSLLAACATTGDDTAAGGDTIVGAWASESFSGAYVYTFNEDGTGNYDAAGTDMPFTYTIDDSNLSILYDGDTLPFETVYTIDGTTLTIKDSLDNDVIYHKQ